MNNTENVIRNSVDEYGTAVVQNRYKKHSVSGLWESEALLVNKYFQKGTTILDLACGSGRTTLPLHKLGYDVTGVDLTPEMIAIAQDTAKREGVDIHYKVGDATNLELKDESFDGALLPNNGLASIPGHANRLRVLQEIRRVTKPGSRIILSIPLRHYGMPYLLYWLRSWIEYIVLARIGYTTKGVDFGDFFYHRNNDGVTMEQVQFLHFFSKKEIEKLIESSGLRIKESVYMQEISPADANLKKGSLSEKDKTEKIEIFYICENVPARHQTSPTS